MKLLAWNGHCSLGPPTSHFTYFAAFRVVGLAACSLPQGSSSDQPGNNWDEFQLPLASIVQAPVDLSFAFRSPHKFASVRALDSPFSGKAITFHRIAVASQ